jgi:hypothetical protein
VRLRTYPVWLHCFFSQLQPWHRSNSAERFANAQVAGAEKPAFTTKLPNVPAKAFLQLRSFTRPVENPQLPSCRKCVCLCACGQDPISKHCHGPGRALFSRAESFFESRGSEHLVSENASTQESPSLLPIFIVDDDANQRRPSAAGACKPNRRTDASRVCSRIRSTKHDHSRRLARRKTSSVLVRVSR